MPSFSFIFWQKPFFWRNQFSNFKKFVNYITMYTILQWKTLQLFLLKTNTRFHLKLNLEQGFKFLRNRSTNKPLSVLKNEEFQNETFSGSLSQSNFFLSAGYPSRWVWSFTLLFIPKKDTNVSAVSFCISVKIRNDLQPDVQSWLAYRIPAFLS